MSYHRSNNLIIKNELQHRTDVLRVEQNVLLKSHETDILWPSKWSVEKQWRSPTSNRREHHPLFAPFFFPPFLFLFNPQRIQKWCTCNQFIYIYIYIYIIQFFLSFSFSIQFIILISFSFFWYNYTILNTSSNINIIILFFYNLLLI